jgi:polyhydroxyalkanoate synthesis regulator phasin
MSIDWPVAFIMMIAIAACAGVISEFVKTRSRSAQDETGAKYADQYRSMVENYETLSKETRESQAALQSKLDEMQKKVDAVEKMLREVG